MAIAASCWPRHWRGCGGSVWVVGKASQQRCIMVSRSYMRASLSRSGTDNLKKPFPPPLLREGAAERKSAGGGKPSWTPVYARRF